MSTNRLSSGEMPRSSMMLVLGMLAACAAPVLRGQSLAAVPGVVVDQEATGRNIYIGTPSITIMPNGDYIASHDLFGSGSTEKTSGISKVFRSTDKGQTWSRVATLTDQFWSTIFQFNGSLYIFGYRNSGTTGDILIRKSTDYGSTWTTPTDSTNGLLRDGDYGGTSNTPVVYANRLWIGQSTRAMSAPVGADLLNANSWKLSNSISQSASWLNGTFTFWSEAQVMASPQTGVVLMPKIGGLPNIALIRANSTTGDITFNPTSDFVDLPGGDKKFGAQYDPVSGRFYVLDNPVLPAHANDPTWGGTPELIRNTGAVLSSKDLYHWDVERLFLYSPYIDYEGFQYFNFAVDGNDMAVISRTAFDVGGTKPPRGHDSNLMTFHTIKNFRDAPPPHLLVADTNHNQILRYEVTQTNWLAPLGKFTLGSSFAGAALNKPMGLVQTPSGDVYVGEETDGGRILRFDAAGNFKEVVATEGVQFTGQPEALALGHDGNLYMSVAFGTNSDKIYKIDPATRQVSTFVDTSFGRSGTLNNPRGIAFDSDGNLYVADRDNNLIRKFDGETGVFITNVNIGNRPQEVTWSKELNQLFAANRDGSDTDLFSIAPDGSSTKIYNPSDIGSALGVQVVNGQVFWTDYDNNKIYKLTGTDQKFTSVFTGLSGLGHLLAAQQPAYGERSWTKSGSGVWSDPLNWYYWGRPDTNYEVASFGSAIDIESTIAMDQPYTMKGLRFRSSNRYLIDGAGSITIAAETGEGAIDVQQGSHQISVPLLLNSNTRLTVANAADVLTLFGDVTAATGVGITKDGLGIAVMKHVRAAGLTVAGGTMKVSLKRSANDPTGTSLVKTLTIAGGPAAPVAQLDLTNNSMAIDYTGASPLHDVRKYLMNGGIITSAGLPAGARLGYAESSLILGGSGGSFAGLAVDATAVLIKFTYGGDTNLDGKVDISDLGRLATGWQTSGAWSSGDFNYDGLIDISDLGILATNWQAGVGLPLAPSVDDALVSLGLGGISVPEPASLVPPALALAVAIHRKRKVRR